MIIEPNTTVRILKDCPLNPNYEHTICFDDEVAQRSYFVSLTKHTLTELTYQRVKTGTMRVALTVQQLYGCNYLMFQNSGFMDKWFYAFIKSINYVNNVTSEIEFEIDVMQTWFFEYELGQCFIERTHTVTDEIGEHTVPENLETGPYVTTASSHLLVGDLNVYVLATEKVGPVVWNDPGIVGGFPVPCYWLSLSAVSELSVTVLKEILDSYAGAGKADSIVAVFTAPSNMVSVTDDIRTRTFNCAPRTLNFIPNNNKLYTYPYCCLTANALGQGVEMRYELFTGTPQMKVRGGFGANMQVSCTPQNYAGQSENLEYSLSLKDFPICAWVTDYYQNWLAQNKASIVVNTLSSLAQSAVGVVGGIATGNVVGAVRSGIAGSSNIANQLATVNHHSIIPDKMEGSANAADIMAVSGLSGFYTFCKAIREEYGRIIDQFFDMYGYKVNTVGVPLRDVRPRWTYNKTSGCIVKGDVPCDDRRKIADIYDNGITFWKNGSDIGNYSLVNKVGVNIGNG